MDKKEKKQVLEQCYYCGNKGYMDIEGSTYDRYENKELVWEEIVFCIVKCPVCGSISLIKKWTADGYSDGHGNQLFDTSVVYPCIKSSRSDSNIPNNVIESLSTVKKIQNIDYASSLIALRRTLEIICKDKGAKKGNLESKIKYLYENDIMPGQLSDASNIIRILGNEGAHGDKISVNAYYIDQLIEFIELIIDYIYVLPARTSQIDSCLKNPNVLVFTKKKE